MAYEIMRQKLKQQKQERLIQWKLKKLFKNTKDKNVRSGHDGCQRRRDKRRSPEKCTGPCPSYSNCQCPRASWGGCGDISVTVDTKQLTGTTVPWGVPTCMVNGESVTVHGSRSPGSFFSEGKTTVRYSVDTKYGDSGCGFTVTVKVRRCNTITDPENGYKSCSHSNIYGSVCSFYCNHGYYLSGNLQRECSKDSVMYWNGEPAICNVRRCHPPLSDINHGFVTCTNSNAQTSRCTHNCEEGYIIDGVQDVTCNGPAGSSTAQNGWWSYQQPNCKDVTPPTFTTCPSSIVTFANEGTRENTTSWIEPQATDNSGESIVAVQVEGQPSGSSYTEGYHTIRYTATDSAGNIGVCVYSVIIYCVGHQHDPGLSTNCPDGYIWGSECQFMCVPGYNLTGITSSRCNVADNTPSGVWSNPQPYCQPKECPALSPPLYGDFYGGDQCYNTFSTWCNFECDIGYDLIGNRYIYCGADTKWNGEQPYCKVRTCQTPDVSDGMVIRNSSFCSLDNDTMPYGSLCDFSCKEGYRLEGAHSVSCGPDGVWLQLFPTCEAITCASNDLPDPINGYKNCSDVAAYGSTCLLNCNYGYLPATPTPRTCINNGAGYGVWSNGTISCQIVMCDPVEEPEHGNITLCTYEGDVVDVDDSQKYGSYCVASCDIGYTANGSISRKCLANGEWDGVPLQCTDITAPEVTCPSDMVLVAPILRNTTTPVWNWEPVMARDAGINFPSTLVEIDWAQVNGQRPAHLSEGSHIMTYVATDAAGNSATCSFLYTVQAVTCPVPSVRNGYVSSCFDEDVDFPTECEFRCDRGFATNKSEIVSTRQCSANQVFSGDDFQCDVTVTCPGPLQIDNGVIEPAECLYSSTLPYDIVCNLQCNQGYEQIGPYSKRCTETGVWSHMNETIYVAPPVFLASSEQFVNVEAERNSTLSVVYFDEPDATDNSGNVTIKRQAGHRGPSEYFPEGSTTVTYIASDASGNYALHDIKVRVAVYRCQAFQTSFGGQVECSSYVHGAVCTFTCNEGYRLVGSDTRSCERNDTGYMYWSGTAAMCEIVTCPALSTPSNAIKSGCLNSPPDTENYGTICSFYCDYGYKESGYTQSQCRADGTWSTNNFTCSEINCVPLVPPNGASVSPVKCTSTPTPGDICTFHCTHHGYEVVPVENVAITCQAIGDWSANTTSLQCVDTQTPVFTTCPDDISVYADRSSNSTTIAWSIGVDDNDGNVPTVTCDYQSGEEYTSGDYSVTCTATDQIGNEETCVFRLSVQVRQCPLLPIPSHATVVGVCDGNYGSTCYVRCDTGHTLRGSDNFTCEYDGSRMIWHTNDQPVCEVTTCEPLELPAGVEVSPVSCSGSTKPQRGTTCTFYCRNQYTLIGNDTSAAYCNDNGLWNHTVINTDLECDDQTIPTIINCPSPVYVSVFDGNGTQVIFDQPSATDNSGIIPTMTTVPPNVTSPLQVMQDSIVKFTYCDTSGNCDVCKFHIYIQDEVPPVLVYCPIGQNITDATGDTLVSWTKPVFEDPLGGSVFVTNQYNGDNEVLLSFGSHTVRYTGTKNNGKQAICEFIIRIEAMICPTLRPPDNGALTCGYLGRGDKYCYMACNNQFEIPRLEAQDVGDPYLCAPGGTWIPGETVPDCSETKNARRAWLGSEVYYYASDCPSHNATSYLEEVFYEMLQNNILCSGTCSIGEVTITCGAIANTRKRSVIERVESAGRARRDTNHKLSKRNVFDNELKVVFVIERDMSDGIDVLDAETEMWDIVDTLQTPIDDDAACSRGSFEDRDKEICVSCARGTYQELTAQTECISCPDGTSTIEEGSRNITACIPKCQAGFYSESGVITCSACDIGYYQPATGQTSCLLCPIGTTTIDRGAASLDQCKVPCEPGYYSSDGMEPCSPCPRRYYQPKYQQQQCILCSGSLTTIGTGTVLNTECVDINECDSNPCLNGSVACHDMIDSYICICADGYTGSRCEVNIDDCFSAPCLNNGTCVDGVNGYFWYNCEENIDECSSSPCAHDSLCTDFVNGFHCHCPSAYYGDFCEHETDFCAQEPCQNGATCVNGVDTYSCVCVAGFTGTICGVNIDDCRTNPCKNKGVCVDGINTYTCQCQQGFTGEECESTLDLCVNNPCLNNGTCVVLGQTTACFCPPDKVGEFCQNDMDLDGPCENGGTYKRVRRQMACACISGYMGKFCQYNIDECYSSPCANGGTCEDGVNFFGCICPPGYQGITCTEEIDECQSNPCAGDSTCIDHINSYTCHCPGGLKGTNCEESENVCSTNPCGETGSCIFGDNSGFICSCTPGYTGFDCSVDINECESIPCLHESTCIDTINGFECQCVDGYTGNHCEINVNDCNTDSCRNGGTCIDGIGSFICICDVGYTGLGCAEVIDYCNSEPCQNGGNCISGLGGYGCECMPDYSGANCESIIDECSHYPCANAESCIDGVGDYTCICNPGWSGKNCDVTIDECMSSPCLNEARCSDAINGYQCYCRPGFTGLHCEIDIDECDYVDCLNGGTCIDGIDEFICICTEGYLGKFCQINSNLCSPNPCSNGGVCVAATNGYSCNCIDGYGGVYCEVDIDDCVDHNCAHGATCIDKLNHYICSCPPGYTGNMCASNINECYSSPCLNDGTCVDIVNGYQCTCMQGYIGVHCEIDEDNCIPYPCDNGAECVDEIDDFNCLCPTGFRYSFYSGKHCSNNIDDCSSESCENGALCIDGVNEFICVCTPGYTGTYCGEALPTDFDLVFTESVESGYCTVDLADGKDIRSWTLSIWAVIESYPGTYTLAIEYTHNGYIVFSVNLTESGVQIAINGVRHYTYMELDDGKWHNIAVTWQSEGGNLAIFKDGHFEDHVDDYQTGDNLPREGVLVIRSIVPGFHGSISALHLWNTVLDNHKIDDIAVNCRHEHHGNLISWAEILNHVDGIIIEARAPSFCDDVDECASNPCTHGGECNDMLHAFKCTCPIEYAGVTCDTMVDFCDGNACQNGGTCEVVGTSYICRCSSDFKGEMCDVGIVCSSLRAPHNGFLDCNETDDETECRIWCQDGYAFGEIKQDIYRCGANSSWKWNHENIDNPTAKLPDCLEIKRPKAIKASFEIVYPSMACTSPDENTEIIAFVEERVERIEDNITCMRNGECSVENIQVNTCNTVENSEQDVTEEGGSIVLTVLQGIDTQGVHANTNPSRRKRADSSSYDYALDSMWKTDSELFTALNMLNDAGLCALNIGGQQFAPDVNASQGEIQDVCQPGARPLGNNICVSCGIGTYLTQPEGWTLPVCLSCPVGHYADEESQIECKTCPESSTTDGRGAINISDCYALSTDETPTVTQESSTIYEPSDPSNRTVMVIAIVAVILSITSIVIIVWFVLRSKGYCKRGSNVDAKLLEDDTRPYTPISMSAFGVDLPMGEFYVEEPPPPYADKEAAYGAST
uniref:Uncharacterized protein LOC100367903 n=1 Tax=Saccoglossus kowalevskii TaxID=10224 RepID=A0ABM0MYB4_SACKO|nr:PREDICTED: uncharacterized protein LOC100367903 [Saccoglossus kowalevskii]